MRDRWRAWFDTSGWRLTIIGVPALWLVVLFLLPFLIVLSMSLAYRTMTAPPYGFGADFPFINLENYARLFQDSLYVRAADPVLLVSAGGATDAVEFAGPGAFAVPAGFGRYGRAQMAPAISARRTNTVAQNQENFFSLRRGGGAPLCE